MNFLKSNDTRERLLRTILQGIIGVIVANLDLLIGSLTIPPEYKPMIVALVMAVLSPIMSELGKKNELSEEQVALVNSMTCDEPDDSYLEEHYTAEELEAIRAEMGGDEEDV